MEENQLLEGRIDEWRTFLQNYKAIEPVEVEELEDHLRNQVDNLVDSGLDEDEAFIIAVKRMGTLNEIAREFAQEYTERLWKQFVSPTVDHSNKKGKFHEITVVLSLAILSAVAIKIPELFGLHFGEDQNIPFYARNFSLFVLPFLACFYTWKRNLTLPAILTLSITFVSAALIANLMPFIPQGDTEILAIVHLPIAMWFAVGYTYAGTGWRNQNQRMNFIRFSGEWFIYYALIALGGGVLMMFIFFIFEAIGMNAQPFVVSWIIPCGVAGAVLVAAWLVEAKQSIIENMAPVLAKIFTPLFTLLLLSFLVTMLVTGNVITIEREVLIGFDLLLVVVLGLLLYSISARDTSAAPNLFDLLQLLLVISALLVDILALWAISGRIIEFGFTPNRLAGFGLNIILLVNLVWSAVLLARFWLKRSPFLILANWQTRYLPVYAIWAVIVTVIFPVLFNYR